MTLNSLFTQASDLGASDLHLVVGKQPIVRIRGELKTLDDEEMTDKKIEVLVNDILTAEQKKRFEDERELDTSFQIKDGTRFRINLHFEKGNMGLVARVIPTKIPTLQELDMPPVLAKLTTLDYGLILVTGPTGCGKSTSIASIIEDINQQRNVNIITLEDPIEFLFESKKSIVRQRQLGTDVLSFDEGLKHILRQDPNVIMVGEMRDVETIAATLTVAETGHLVFATLHTNNAAESIDRIVDVFPPHKQNQVRLQLSSSLKAVISQRLIPAVNGNRVAAREILLNNPAVSNLIRENKVAQIKSVIETSADQGMITMDHHIKQLLKQGLIDQSTAEAHVTTPEALKYL